MTEKKRNVINIAFDIISSGKVWFLLFFILISLFAINHSFSNNGVVINGITPNSASEKAQMNYDSKDSLRSLEKIYSINENKINTEEEFYLAISNAKQNSTINIITNRNEFGYNVYLPLDENKTNAENLGISVRAAPTSNLKLGIELEGGSRLILAPTKNLTPSEYDLLVNTLQNRLDVYGASGTKVNKLEDAFSNQKFVFVESTSSNKNDIFELIKKQGNFEAKVGNVTVFTGENIIRVFNDPAHAGLEGCSKTQNENTICTFRFSIEIDSKGADKFFEETQKLSVINGGYLSEKVSFYLDGKEITSLNIASSFKYQKITTPQITVSGNEMQTEEKALESGKKEMKFLQAILSTKSLPSELDVVQSYAISNSQGEKFLKNAILVGLAAVLLVSLVVALRYKHFGIFIGITITLISEMIIVFGAAAFLRLTIDLAAIGGLIAAIGTGVDDQIIITDEYFRKRDKKVSSKNKIKGAYTIILISYFATVAAMAPLYFAGLKSLQGFAFMIIIGVTVGILITRPAYAEMLNRMMTSKEERTKEDND